MRPESVSMRVSWIGLTVVSIGIFGFGVVMALVPMKVDNLLYRADGLAALGLGLFGGLLAMIPFRRRERWAWYALWFYPVFWLAHLIFGLPPGTDHVHQVVFIVFSLGGLLIPALEFFRAS
jgi:hypothetical protein